MPVYCIQFVCRHNVVDCEPDLEQRQGRIVHYGGGSWFATERLRLLLRAGDHNGYLC